MIRFRNPSSSLETMLASFEELYQELKEQEYFDNDDIANVLAKANLMASSGFTGDVAIARGANSDRSRDKTYNNAKMFAETFRLLGLISIVNNVSSNYRFTFIGQHMVAKNADKKAIVEQCVLGMNNPNRIMDVSYDENIRFFKCVLLTMYELDDYICRDEMILGPMSINDISDTEFSKMVDYIKSLRKNGNFEKLQQELKKLAQSLSSNKKGGMSVTSVQNCTRFPISVLKYCDWVESENKRFYGKSVRFMKLTNHGKEVVEKLNLLKDIRLEDYESSSYQEKKALIRLGTYQMLGRANFDLESVGETIVDDKNTCKEILQGKDLLFSPYQTLEYTTVNSALNLNIELSHSNNDDEHRKVITTYRNKIRNKQEQYLYINKNSTMNDSLLTNDVEDYINHVLSMSSSHYSIDEMVELLMNEHLLDKKTEFYPFVEVLFRIIGVDCHKSRDGVNGERWDAMIRDKTNSIPIEIKSPTEELHISIKAVRQALENKIILLSRKTYPTTEECSSYAVGYYPPNDRAEVADLVECIQETYGYKIAVFDIASLIKISLKIILNNTGVDLNKLLELEGVVNVTDFES